MKLSGLPVLLFFILLIPFMALAQPPFAFNESGYDAVIKQAVAEKKPIFYFLYANWCPHCHKMTEKVFPDENVSAFLKQNFIAAAQDINKPEGEELVRKFKASIYPTYIIIDENGELLYGFDGERTREEFLREIKAAANPDSQLPYLRKTFLNNPSDGQKCLQYVSALRKARQRTDEAAALYLSTQSDSQLQSALNWKIITNGISEIKSREFQYVLSHQKEFAVIASTERVKNKIVNIITETLQPFVSKADMKGYEKARTDVKSIGLRMADSISYNFDRQLYESVQDWKSYQAVTIENVRLYSWNNYAQLRDIANVYATAINDVAALKAAIKWAERSSELQNSKETYLLISRLYEKVNDIPKAIEAAMRAIEYCKKIGFGTKEADEALKRLQQPK